MQEHHAQAAVVDRFFNWPKLLVRSGWLFAFMLFISGCGQKAPPPTEAAKAPVDNVPSPVPAPHTELKPNSVAPNPPPKTPRPTAPPPKLKLAETAALVDLTRSAVGPLLETRLLNAAQLTWLERSSIEKILKEQELQALFSPESGSQRAKLGKLLKADLIVLLRSQENPEKGKGQSLELVVCETQRGLRLMVQGVPLSANPETDVAELERLIGRAFQKQAEKITDIGAVPPFISNDLDYRYDHLKAGYAKVIEQHLLSRPGFLLVELAEAKALTKEVGLTAAGTTLERQVPLYFIGEYRNEGKGEQRRLTLGLKIMRGPKELAQATKSGLSQEEAPQALRRLAAELADKVAGSKHVALSPTDEAQQLAQRAAAFQKVGHWEESVAVCEASLLLNLDQPEVRRLAAHAYATLSNFQLRTAFKDPEAAFRGLHLYRRAMEHQEMYLRSEAPHQPPIKPHIGPPSGHTYSRESYTVSHHLSYYKPQTKELHDLKVEIRHAERESLLRLTRWRAQAGCGDEHRYLSWAMYGVPDQEKYSVILEVVLELQNLPWAKERTILFVQDQRPLQDSPAYEAILGQLSKVGNQEVKAAAQEMRQTLQTVRAMKTKSSPGLEKPLVSNEVGFLPVDKSWATLGGQSLARSVFFGCLPVGDKIDLLLAGGSVFLMKEKSKLKAVWQAGELNAWPENACYDGRFAWIPVRRYQKLPLLLVLDPVSERVWQITSEDGLPLVPFEDLPDRDTSQYLVTAPLAPGKICVAGYFGRTWLAIVTFDPAKGKTVKVFHEAREVPDLTNKEQGKQTTIAFQPACMFVLQDKSAAAGQPAQRVLIGRDCPNPGLTMWPLLVDPEKLTVAVAPEITYLDDLKMGTILDGSLYTAALFPKEAKRHFFRIDYPGTKKELLFRDLPQGKVVFHGGRLNLIGTGSSNKCWSGSLAEKQVRLAAQLPGELYWVGHSVHYGLLMGSQDPKGKRHTHQVVFGDGTTPVAVAKPDPPPPPTPVEPRPKTETPVPPQKSPAPKANPEPGKQPSPLIIGKAIAIKPIVSELSLITVGAGPQARLVAALNQPPEVPDLDAKITQGILTREIFRQGLLLTARESFGLETRDAVLGETIPPGGAGAPMEFSSLISAPSLHLKLTKPSPAGGTQQLLLVDLPWQKNVDYILRLVERVEILSREEFRTALATAGAGRRVEKRWGNIPVPAETARRLNRFTLTDQFAALRDLHGTIQNKGESPALLGALVRAYANLGVLTEFHWTPAHKAFKARALLYAQRLVAADGESPWGRWHRAYALALTGMHGLAIQDLAQASKLPAPQSSMAQPAWVHVVEAFCRFDTNRLGELARGEEEHLANLLQFFTVENPTTRYLALDIARRGLKTNPECYRLHDGLCLLGGVSALHQATVLPFAVFNETVPKRLEEMPALPDTVKVAQAGSWKQNESRILKELRASLAPGEPSWSALAALLHETRFAHVWQRFDFLRTKLVVPVADFLKEALPLVGEHPYRGYLAIYGQDSAIFPKALLDFVPRLRASELELIRQKRLVLDFQKLDFTRGQALNRRILANTDLIHRDLDGAIYLLKSDRARLGLLLTRISPRSPVARAALIEGDWNAVKQEAVRWEKEEPSPFVLAALGKRYSAQYQWEDAERCLRAYLQLSPDRWAYTALATIYLNRNDTVKWLETMEESLKQEDNALDHAKARVDIARHFMKRGDFKKAQPYADAAAETGAEWAMRCASECHEALHNWEQAEQWIARTAQRYPNAWLDWLTWCQRTGKGDVAAARKWAEQQTQQPSEPLSSFQRSRLAYFHVLAGQPAQALPLYQKAFAETKEEATGFLVALTADLLKKNEQRDQAWTALAQRPTRLGQLAKLCQEALAKNQGRLDGQAIDNLLDKLNPVAQGEILYFSGRFLAQHGHVKDARIYLERCVRTTNASSPTFTLASVALRDLPPAAPNKEGSP